MAGPDDDAHGDTVKSVISGPSHRATTSNPTSYELGPVLGRGGMGEVVLAHDPRIGRDVALKRMITEDPTGSLTERFLREARIQARLDHPAIVPVHELGHDAEGRPYFVMKRIAGKTLREVLNTGAIPLNRLLRTLVEVCLAMELAHTRGVIHRDLKPANIILGDYGEVYVIDWGVARELDERGEAKPGVDSIGATPSTTELGALLGTPGYAAPEQIRGEPIGTAADVYALGAMLFEILVGGSLHPRERNAAIASTLTEPTVAPASRGNEIAPELDALCVDTLAATAEHRPSAREVADRLQAFLDGDRDVLQRKKLASEHLARAQEAHIVPARRTTAVYEAGQAVALDPDSLPARTLLMTLLIEPPTTLPQPLVDELADIERELASREARGATFTLATYFALIPMMITVGIRNTGQIVAMFALIAMWIGYTTWIWRWKKRSRIGPVVFNLALMLLMSRLVGPFILIPGLVVAFSVITVQQALLGRPVLVVCAAVLAIVLPVVLEVTGVFEQTWSTAGDAIAIKNAALELASPRGIVFIAICNSVLAIVTTVLSHKVATERRDAQQRLAIQAWHLRHLLPSS